MNKVVLTDTGFWIGLIDPNDQFHEASSVIEDLIEGDKILFPWPCLYETISTRLIRKRAQLQYLEKAISKPDIVFFQDEEYREEALKHLFQFYRNRGLTYSLADCVIREILKDVNVKVNYLITYNSKDFRDICDQRKIDIIDNQ